MDVSKASAIENCTLNEKDENSIPLKQRIAFTLGLASDHYAMHGLNNLIMPVYNILLGANPTTIGVFLALARIWDAFADLFFGNFSDNFRSKWGRRRPFIAAGAIFTGVVFPLLWMASPSWGELTTLMYLFIILFVYYTCYTMMSVSYEAISMEMTSSYEERSRLFSFRKVLYAPLSLGIPWIVALTYLDFFSSPLEGARYVGCLIGVIIAIFGIVTAVYCKEVYYGIAQTQKKTGFFESLQGLHHNKPVMLIIVLMGINLFCVTVFGSLAFYVKSFYLFDGDIKAAATLTGVSGTLKIISVILGALIAYRLSDSYAKEKVLSISIFVMVVSSLANWFTFTPSAPYLSLLAVPFITAANSIFWITIIAMKADACDWEEKRSGLRREGVVSGLTSWCNKASMSAAILFSGILLSWAGFDTRSSHSVSERTIEIIRVSFVFIPAVCYSLSLCFSLKYPLNKKIVVDMSKHLAVAREVST